MEEKNTNSAVETTTYEPVPAEQRRPWTSIMFIWMGSAICVPALMVGGMIGAGMKIGPAFLAMIAGFVLVCIYMILIGIQGSDLGMPTTAIFSRAFGERGSTVASGLVIAICGIGWFGVQTTVCGTAFCTILKDFCGVDFPIWLSDTIWGVAMLLTAVYGIKVIDFLNKIAVPALLIMLVWGLIVALKGNAVENLRNYEPAAPITFIGGTTLAVSGFAVGAVLSSDYTRYSRSRGDTIKSSVLGVLPASILVLGIGGILTQTTGNYDLTVMFSGIGLPLVGLLCLILATWTTNCGNAYSGGIAIVGVFKMKDDKRAIVTLIAGAIGTVLSIVGIMNYFTPFLSFISVLVPPMAGVVIADYWILGKGKKEDWKPFKGVNWLGLISWACGTAFGMVFKFLIPTINAVIVAMIVYFILIKLVKSEKVNPFCHN